MPRPGLAVAALIEAYARYTTGGQGVLSIAHTLGYSYAAVRTALLDCGCTMRPRGQHAPGPTKETTTDA